MTQVYTYKDADFATCPDCGQSADKERQNGGTNDFYGTIRPTTWDINRTVYLHASNGTCPNWNNRPIIARSRWARGIRLHKNDEPL